MNSLRSAWTAILVGQTCPHTRAKGDYEVARIKGHFYRGKKGDVSKVGRQGDVLEMLGTGALGFEAGDEG
jgi:hypothetical protein